MEGIDGGMSAIGVIRLCLLVLIIVVTVLCNGGTRE